MKKIILISGVIIIAGAVIWFVSSRPLFKSAENAYVMPNYPVACTQEAKLCPDGSYVGRTGPNCEFAECPATAPMPVSTKSGISGKVTLGPTCPVEQMPPILACAPKGYATSIRIRKEDYIGEIHGNPIFVKTISTDSSGHFETVLPAGAYILDAQNNGKFPICPETEVLVKSNQYTKTEMSCDSGIR